MLMAMESGEILAKSIEKDFLFDQIAQKYQTLHSQKFQKRLQVCHLLRRAAFAPNLAKWIISTLSFSERIREILAKATRPNPFTSEK